MSSSSLERLKALTSKLEDKIAEKRAVTSPAESTENDATTVESEQPEETKKPHTSETTTPVSKPEPVMTVLVKEESAEKIREENIERVHLLYDELKIYEKCPDFGTIFSYKAMNLSGIGLKEEDFGIVREGKYIQVIAITYEPDKTGKKKAKNISLGYFGKGETIDPDLKNRIIEFVLRWRYEKAFQNVQHYRDLLSKLDRPKTLF
jgi:hypothetical protein